MIADMVLGFYAIIFMAAVGSNDYENKLVLGPYLTFQSCIENMAYGLGDPETGLRAKFPEWKFKVSCIDRAPSIELKTYELTELYELMLIDLLSKKLQNETKLPP